MNRILNFALAVLLFLPFIAKSQSGTYPFIGKRYFISKEDNTIAFEITISRQGKMQIDEVNNNQPQTVYEGDYKAIIKNGDVYIYAIKKDIFQVQNFYQNGAIFNFYPDQSKNALQEEKTAISDKSLKGYVGNYTFNDFVGQAHYTYQQANNGERVFNGSFGFSGNMANKLFLKIQGQFKNDYKQGLWTYTSTLKKGLVTSLTQTLSANYNEGVLNGIIKVFANTTIHGADRNHNIIINGNGTVSHGNFVGSITYNRTVTGRNILLKPLKLKGQFNDDGFCDGTWSLIYQEQYGEKMYEAKYEFINGILVSYQNINEQTGEIESSSENPELVVFAKQLTGTINTATANGERKKWKVGSVGEDSPVDIKIAEVQNLFCDPMMHQSPKGLVGDLPQFKVRIPDFN